MATSDSTSSAAAESSEQIFTQIMALRGLAVSLADKEMYAEALEILTKAEKMCHENRRIDALLTILYEKARTSNVGGDPDSALQIIEEAEQICYALSEWETLYHVLLDKTVFYAFASRPPQKSGGTSNVLKEWLQLARKGQDPANLVNALVVCALNFLHLDTAVRQNMLDEAFDIASKHELRDHIVRIQEVNAHLKGIEALYPTLIPNPRSRSKPQPIVASVNQPIVLLSLEHRFEQTEKLARTWCQQSDYVNALHLTLLFFQRSRTEFTQNDSIERVARLVKTCLEAFPKPEAEDAGVTPANDLELQFGLGLFTTFLGTLAHVFIYKRDFSTAKRLAELAVEIGWLHLGELNPQLDLNLRYLIDAHFELQEYELALPRLRQKLKVMERIGSFRINDWVATLNKLAMACRYTGGYPEAEQAYLDAIKLNRVLNSESLEMAVLFNNLAILYVDMGQLSQAEAYYKQALEVRQAKLGWSDPQVIASIKDLAALYSQQGNLSQAVSILEEALGQCRPVLGDHPEVASLIHSLGNLWAQLGNAPRAHAHFGTALEMRRAILGANHPDVAATLRGLADTALLREQQLDYIRQALEVQRAATGEQSPEFARYLSNWALLTKNQQGFRGTRALLKHALAIQKATLDAHSSDIIGTLNRLGLLHHTAGDYRNAESYYREVLTLSRDLPGPMYDATADVLTNLATVCAAQARLEEALAFQQEALLLYSRNISSVLTGASERQRAQYLAKFRGDLDIWFSIAVRHLSNVSPSQALELVCRYKGINGEAELVQRYALQAQHEPALLSKFQEIKRLREKIRDMWLAGPSGVSPFVFKVQLTKWEQERERLEREVAAQIPELRLNERLLRLSSEELAQKLPNGSALIEYIYFNEIDFNYIESAGGVVGPGHYLALVAVAGPEAEIHLVDIGPADPVDRCVDSLLSYIRTPKAQGHYAVDIYDDPPDMAIDQVPDFALRQMVFDPLIPILGDYKRLFIAPDGELNRLPFDILRLSPEEYLIDRYTVSYLGTGRDLLRFGVRSTTPPHDPVVIANPTFDMSQAPTTSTPKPRLPFGWQQEDMDINNWSFQPLPGTQWEGEQIAELLGVQPWLGDKARKGDLKAYRSPFILHLATHGFFQKNQPGNSAREVDLFLTGFLTSAAHMAASVKVDTNLPYLRSGLALAGANTWLAGGTPPPEVEDGLLTAEDVLSMDLSATELVVLSACETGLGDIQVGEGVFGLRRSFILAGAKTVVMSLWSVPDKQTQELMSEFYHYLLDGWPRVEALRESQLTMKAKYAYPYFWGAFICQGDPSPLPPRT
jgi:CHAT domain-containing protein/tetratricopeptide (TPR) repeat protein